MRPSSPSPTTNPAPTAAAPAAATAVALAAPATAAAHAPTTPVPHRYETRVGPIPPSPTHPRPSRRPPPPKRARTSGLIESSSSWPQEPHSSPNQGPAYGSPQDQSPGFIIKRPILHYGPILGNSDCSGKDLHNENFYDIPAFVALPEHRDSMRLVQWYSLEPFMTPRRFFYPRVVIEFY